MERAMMVPQPVLQDLDLLLLRFCSLATLGNHQAPPSTVNHADLCQHFDETAGLGSCVSGLILPTLLPSSLCL